MGPPAEWYVWLPDEARPLLGPAAGPFETEDEAWDWVRRAPALRDAALWQYPPPPDSRAAGRHRPAAGTVCRVGDGPGGAGARLVWDLSAAGLGLLVPAPAEPGAVLRGELA